MPADWAHWNDSESYTVGVEEEVMLLDPEGDWPLAQRIDEVLPRLSKRLGARVTGETHGSAVELSTAGLRKPVGEFYPARAFAELCARAGVPFALSSDAHLP